MGFERAGKRGVAAIVAIPLLLAALACNKGPGMSSSTVSSNVSPAAAVSGQAAAEVKAGDQGAPAAPAADISFPGANLATYVATNYAFDGPRSLAAGLTTFRLVNRGQELHHLILAKLTGGKSAEDLVKAMEAEPHGAPPGWAVLEGGPAGTVPGSQSNATLVLEPGSYAVVCVIPSADGVAHFAKGMMEAVEVVPESRTVESPEPEADLTVKLVDYDFRLPESVSAGRHVVRVDNAGDEPHELVVWRLPPGKSLADLLSWVDGGLAGPPPGKPIGGLSPVKAGGHGYFVTDLPAGDYALICFVPDDEDGKPHFAHGMAKQITVG